MNSVCQCLKSKFRYLGNLACPPVLDAEIVDRWPRPADASVGSGGPCFKDAFFNRNWYVRGDMRVRASSCLQRTQEGCSNAVALLRFSRHGPEPGF
jgi:hypothetical protein